MSYEEKKKKTRFVFSLWNFQFYCYHKYIEKNQRNKKITSQIDNNYHKLQKWQKYYKMKQKKSIFPQTGDTRYEEGYDIEFRNLTYSYRIYTLMLQFFQ